MSCLSLPVSIPMVLFDLVGTILTPAVPVGETYAAMAARHGLRVPPEAIAQRFPLVLSRYRCRPRATVPSDGEDRAYWREILFETLSPEIDSWPGNREALVEELYGHYGGGNAWRLYPEVRGVLRALRKKGVRLGILSNWDRRAHGVLSDLGLREFFSVILLSAELGAAKPDPYLYRLVSQRIGLPAASLFLVGDDVENDGTAPRACGFGSWVCRRPERTLEMLPLLSANGVLS
ncbi:Phosphatase [Methylacidimicrobium cyclopophantes]|uniref:Phosphatase n=1 Tax=Methylacidimicrobium cyclopophantes TaxID=1041766 RepID=A0A5E6MQN7_9BACT|nr:HAD-IA family hydrolase [Methylacidimicrobium cyclopophantes]VVM08491.1 Phosphatase [Methylacidimicrobium cyclopophantes]